VLHFKQCNIKSAFGHGHSHGGGGGGGGIGHGHSHIGGHGHSHSRREHSHGGHGHSHGHSHQHDGGHDHQQSLAPVESVVINDNGSNRYSVLSIDSTVDDDQLILADDCSDSVISQLDVNVKPKTNINIRAAFVHVIGDLIQSIGVLVAAVVIHVWVRNNFQVKV